MKRALLAATAIVSASFGPLMTTPAFADATQAPVPLGLSDTSGETTQCNALAAAHDLQNGDIWSAVVVPGAATQVAGPTEVAGTRMIDHSSITPVGTYVPGHLYINGDPVRTGGSVNMFGDQRSSAGYYPDQTYNYTAQFTSTFSYAFSCNVMDSVYHAAYTDPAVPMQGYYTVDPKAPGSSETNRENCDAFTALGDQNPRPDWWGTYHAWCDFNKTADAIPPVYHPAYNSPAVFVDNEAGVAITQDQTDTLNGFEQHGGILYVTGDYDVGQVVICISPGSKGGAWKVQNGYNGGSLTGPAAGCNTPYFKVAPITSGSTTSQGTFISVPNYNE
jgi:hypothetical protein